MRSGVNGRTGRLDWKCKGLNVDGWPMVRPFSKQSRQMNGKEKGNRHIALLVEDDPEMAIELGELLVTLGYDHIHASTKVEADELVKQGQFCFVLLDLRIKLNSESRKPRLEAGLTLLAEIRAAYPRRNQLDKRCLQILVTSDQDKEIHHVIAAFQNGADDFIVKPIGENQLSVREKIKNALRHSGRLHHSKCAAIMASAKTAPDPVIGPIVQLAITDRKQGKRVEVRINDRTAALSSAPLVLLLRLIAQKFTDTEGWVHRQDVGGTMDQGWKGISRLKNQLSHALPDGVDIYENDGAGSYRLNPQIEIARVDLDELQVVLDGQALELARQIGNLQQQ